MSDLGLDQKPSRRLWIIAAAVALALHAGGAALAFAHLRADAADEELGAPAIEIGLEMMSPRLEPTELPPGPDTPAAVASPAIAEQKAELKETELPKDTPTETEEPDRVVTPNDSSKPKEDDTKVATVPLPPRRNRLPLKRPRCRASIPRRSAPRSVAPVQGVGKALERDEDVLVRGVGRASRQAQAQSAALQKFRDAKVVVDLTLTVWASSSPAVSQRVPAMRPMTRRRLPCCAVPIRCRSLRRSLPTKDCVLPCR